jgi:hypothetical protein
MTHEPSEIERRDKHGAWQAVGTRTRREAMSERVLSSHQREILEALL